MNQPIQQIDFKKYHVKRYNFKKWLQSEEFLIILFKTLCVIGVIMSIICAISQSNNKLYFLINTTIIIFLIIIAIFHSKDAEEENNESLIPNKKNGKPYFLCLGYKIEKFYGDAVKSIKAKNNVIEPILVNAEIIKRHVLCMATVGAGKSVFMKGLIEQHLLSGGGGMIIDGKGTDEFAREIYGLFASVGRENDFYYLNFIDVNESHSINPLASGNYNTLFEILTATLPGEENEWKAKQKEMMENLLKILVFKRDNENFLLNFEELAKSMSLPALVKLGLKYRAYAKTHSEIQDFILYISTTISISYEEFIDGDETPESDFMKKVITNQNADTQGIYDIGNAIQAWRPIIIELQGKYKKIFNKNKPDISLWEATQKNKWIFVSLPSMDSDTTPKRIGRLILGLIKAVAQQKAKEAKEPEIPFVVYADELGTYITEGFARLKSKSRSIGIPIISFFQSMAQIDQADYGKGLERKEDVDVTGLHILMKTMSPEVTEFYQKMTPKIEILTQEESIRRDGRNEKGNIEDSTKKEEKPAFEHDEVTKLSNGEMMIFASGKLIRAVAKSEDSLLKYGKKTTFQPHSTEPIPIVECMPKDDFLKQVFEYGGKVLDERIMGKYQKYQTQWKS